jgi:glycosyltransferase involved in cell wall biosynthesis
MRKVLIFSVAYHPFIGGAEIAVKEITNRLTDIEFHLITVNLDGKQKKEEKVGNVNVYRLGSGKFSKFFLPITGYLKAKKLSRTHDFSVIWPIMASQASIAASFFKMSNPRIPLILTIQEGDEETYLKRYVFGSSFLYKIFIRPWHSLVFRKANHITVISSYLALRAKSMNAHVPVTIIPNGVNVDFFSQASSGGFSDAELEKTRQEVGKEKGDRLIITTSRLVVKNGLTDLIESLVYLPHSVKLAIIGKGDLEQSLRKQVEKLNLSKRVVFLGEKPNEELPKYLALADVFVRASLSEGMGNSFIEAMAAHVPVVGTPVGGIPDFLKDKETGLFCEPENPYSIAQTVEIILNNPDLKNKITHEAFELVKNKYSWDKIAGDMKKVLVD